MVNSTIERSRHFKQVLQDKNLESWKVAAAWVLVQDSFLKPILSSSLVGSAGYPDLAQGFCTVLRGHFRGFEGPPVSAEERLGFQLRFTCGRMAFGGGLALGLFMGIGLGRTVLAKLKKGTTRHVSVCSQDLLAMEAECGIMHGDSLCGGLKYMKRD